MRKCWTHSFRAPFLWLAMTAPFCGPALALPASVPEKEAPFPAFLEGHDPSYFILVGRPSHYMSYMLSVKYPITLFQRSRGSSPPSAPTLLSRFMPYLTYTTKYDFFYLGARASEPVLIRLQNAGLKLKYELPGAGPMRLKSVAAGYFHESNGQVIETKRQYLAAGSNAMDSVSRGWDYMGTDIRFLWPNLGLFGQAKASFNLYVRTRFYLPLQLGGAYIEDVLFWEEISRKVSIRDYDGLRLTAILRNPAASLLVQLRSGYTGPKVNLSFNAQVTCRILDRLPGTLLFFRGYGRDISSYHIFDSFFGFGLELW